MTRHPLAARDVPVGASWIFPDHRTCAEVEQRQAVMREARDKILRTFFYVPPPIPPEA